MAFDKNLLDKIDEAIERLISGKRQVSVTVGGKQITYGQADLAALQELRDRVYSEINVNGGETNQSSQKQSKFLRISTNKGT